MTSTPHNLINCLRTMVVGAWRNDPRTDAELLSKYVEARDEMAFAALMWRHGTLVWRTCRHVLGDTTDAEDAFQSTFLALSRKADRLRREPLAGWLYRVARHASINIRIGNERRGKLEHKLRTEVKSNEKKEEDICSVKLREGLDEELASLSEKLRIPLLMHYLEGRSQAEVARILGCAKSSVQKRLTKGEAILRKRLEQRGLALGDVALSAMWKSPINASSVPSRLIESTARAAVAFRVGAFTGIRAEATEKLLRSLSLKGAIWKGWLVVLACIGGFGLGGIGLIAWGMYGDGSNKIAQTESVASQIATQEIGGRLHQKKVDRYGDPLPEGAIARIGTVRFRSQSLIGSELTAREIQKLTALSPDGKILVTVDSGVGARRCGSGISFWDTCTGKQTFEHYVCPDPDCSFVYLSNGKLLIAVAQSVNAKISTSDKLEPNSVVTLDPVSGKLMRDAEPLHFEGYSPTFSGNGKVLVCETPIGGGQEVTDLIFYDVGLKKLLRKVRLQPSHQWDIRFKVFSHDARYLACFNRTEDVDILDSKTGKEVFLETGIGRKVQSLAFAPDGRIVTGDGDNVVRVWDLNSGRKLMELGKLDRVPQMVSMLPDNKTVLAACSGQIRFWDITTGKATRSTLNCKGLVQPVILSADGLRLIDRVMDATNIWDLTTGKEIGPTANVSKSQMYSLVFSPDSAIVATGAELLHREDGNFGGCFQDPGMDAFNFWETVTGKPLGSLPVPTNNTVRDLLYKSIWPSKDTFMALGFQGRNLTSRDRAVFRWKIAPNVNTSEGSVYPGGDYISPNGQVMVCSQSDNFELIEVTTGKKIASIPIPRKIEGLCFSQDGEVIAVKETDAIVIQSRPEICSKITLWETNSGRMLYSFNLAPSYIQSQNKEVALREELVGFSPDGRHIITISNHDCLHYSINLWEHLSGKLRLRLALPSDCYNAKIVFSPDSRLVAAFYQLGSRFEKTVHLWDLATGQEYQRFQGHANGNYSGNFPGPEIVFSPNGRYLATAGGDYTVLIWKIKEPPTLEVTGKQMSQKELQTLKIALSNVDDAASAYQAMWKLCQVPDQAVPLMAECLQSQTPPPDSKQIVREVNRLIGDLDSNDFQTRAAASKVLAKKLNEESGKSVTQDTLLQTLSEKPTIEVAKAIRTLLVNMDDNRRGANSPELTYVVRVIEVLERVNNDTARELLTKLVTSSWRPEVRYHAQAALKRLSVPRDK